MRKLRNLLKTFLPVAPFAFLANYNAQSQDQEDNEHDLTPEIETHINKIFLTPDVSEFSNLKIFAFDA